MLWQSINETIRDKLGDYFVGDISLPPVFVESIPDMGLSMELSLREEETLNAVEKGITNLCKYGATIIAIACNTTQYFTNNVNEICEKYNATFIPMVTSTVDYLKKDNIKNFDFLGIKYVLDFNKWSAFKKLSDDFKVNIPSEQDIKKINELAFEVKKKVVSARGVNKLRELINKSTKTDTVLIALTELSILLDNQKRKQRSDKKYIDTLTILAKAIAEKYITEIMKRLKINN